MIYNTDELNELSQDEQRTLIIKRARELYINSGITNNITVAVDLLYKDHKYLFINIKRRITNKDCHRPQTIIDNYERPICPYCNNILFLKPKCSGLQAGDYFYIWICKKCGFEEYSDLTLPEILATLKPKEG